MEHGIKNAGTIRELAEFAVANALVGYDYKNGYWSYWYQNGALMASGSYDPVKEGFQTTCSSDTILRVAVTPK